MFQKHLFKLGIAAGRQVKPDNPQVPHIDTNTPIIAHFEVAMIISPLRGAVSMILSVLSPKADGSKRLPAIWTLAVHHLQARFRLRSHELTQKLTIDLT